MPYLNSTVAEKIYTNTEILARVKFILLRCAAKFLKEDAATPHHDARVSLANKVLHDIDNETRRIALTGLAISDITEPTYTAISTTPPRELAKGQVISHEDLDALFVGLIEAGWNTFAGVIENPTP